MTMIYYAFNDNKPLRFKNEDYQYQIVHYCPHCNTLTCGEWATEKPHKLKSTIKQFANTKICPVCNGAYDENEKHHFVREISDDPFYYGRNMFYWDSLYLYVLRGESFDELGISCDEFDMLQEGEKIFTDFGPATVVEKLYPDSKENSKIRLKYDYCYKDILKSIAAMLNYYHSKKHNQIAENKVEAFANGCIKESKNTIETSAQKSDNFILKEYLKQLITIEKNIFSLSKRLKELYFENVTAEKDAFVSEKLATSSNTGALNRALELCETLKKKNVVNGIKITDFPITYPKLPKKPQMPKEPVLATPGFFNKKRVLAENMVLTEKYEKELESYNLAVEKYEADLKNYDETKVLLERQRYESYKSAVEDAKNNLEKEIAKAQAKYDELLSKQQETERNAKDIPTPEKAKHQFLKEEIEIAEDLLKNFYKARNEMYSYGVIFEKYRNFVAVSSFYEYISSGRCETLEGANGAYNIYENETRMNMVISQLNQVIESLEEIKQNQYMIYSAIQETNEQLETLNSSTSQMLGALNEINEKATSMESYMSKISYNTKVTAYNTEKTAFYAKKNAELTNALGFLVALK